MSQPLVRRVETRTGHFYLDQNDNQIPGVTTILKALPKDALEDWRLRKAVSLAVAGPDVWSKDKPDGADLTTWLITAGDREANKAAVVGTAAHEFAEQYMLGNEPSLDDLKKAERKHAECFLQWVRDHEPKPILVEKVLTHIDAKSGLPLYCGTMDIAARLNDGFAWLVDYKASSKQARSSHALQAAAYRYATHWLDTETGELHPMPEVDRAAVVLLNGGGADHCYRMYELDTSPVVFSLFKSLLRIHSFSKIEHRVILGEVLA